jgi:hypothetical protein
MAPVLIEIRTNLSCLLDKTALHISLDPWTGWLIGRRGEGESAFCVGRIWSVEVLMSLVAEGTFGATISCVVAGDAEV